MSVIEWVRNHWDEVVQIYLAIIGIASIIVKITPTIKDNEILEKIIKFLGRYVALNRTVNDDAIRAASKK